MFAIGGINQENLSQVLKTGATRIAVSHAVIEADEPKVAVRELKSALEWVAQLRIMLSINAR